MREILFRGKRKDNGEWVEGAYFCLQHNDERKHIHHFIIPDNTDISKDRPIGDIQVEVIPETIGQYTGLKDCNGKKIFEGDRVTDDNDFVIDEYQDGGIIQYSDEDGMFIITNDIITSYFNFYRSDEFMVTGNIYDDQKG